VSWNAVNIINGCNERVVLQVLQQQKEAQKEIAVARLSTPSSTAEEYSYSF
jgi:hypothetical protein